MHTPMGTADCACAGAPGVSEMEQDHHLATEQGDHALLLLLQESLEYFSRGPGRMAGRSAVRPCHVPMDEGLRPQAMCPGHGIQSDSRQFRRELRTGGIVRAAPVQEQVEQVCPTFLGRKSGEGPVEAHPWECEA